MPTTSANKAAWIKAAHQPLQVDSAPYPTPGHGELVVKNALVAVNPVDWKIQESGMFVREYPWILGTDVAGVVVDVGPGVTRFRKGDRVISYALSLIKPPSYGAFQLYTQADELVTSPIPDDLPFENAVVLPLAISTAAAGLYEPQLLHQPYPTLHSPSAPRKPASATLIVWGASSSVGSAVSQLGVASGLDIVGTASSRTAPFARDMGARAVVDYKSANVDKEVVAEVRKSGLPFAGVYDAVGTGGWENIMKELGGGRAVSVLGVKEDRLPPGVVGSGLFAATIADAHKPVANAVWRDFVPKALQSGQLRAKPDPIVIEGGLEKMQESMNRQKQGVSAAKIVVRVWSA